MHFIVHYRSPVAEFEVRDTGPGIHADDLDRIFAPFERGALGISQPQTGTGLGLTISMLLAGVPLSECVLYTSGRVPMDMVRKAIRAGVPALVSKTMPTVQSLELAAEYGLQFVCGRKRPLTLKEHTK